MVVDFLPKHFKISVQLENSFDFLSVEYHTLHKASSATVFQAPLWLATFYKTLVDTLSLEPVVVTARNQDGLLLGVIPCVRQSVKGVKIIQPADMGVSDYNCIVVRDDALSVLKADQEMQHAIEKVLAPFDVFFFRKQRPDIVRIEDIMPDGSVSCNDNKAYEVALESSYDSWVLNNLSANFRQSNRRKFKKLIAKYDDYQFENVTDQSKIADALTFIRNHRSARFDNDILKQPAFFDFYLKLALENTDTGFAQTTISTINGKIVAAFFGVNHDARHCYLLGAFVPEKYDAYSIGTLTMMGLIKDRIDHNFSVFDFALGNESYKDRFGAVAIDINNTVYAKTPVGKMISYIYKNAKPLKKLLTSYNSKLH